MVGSHSLRIRVRLAGSLPISDGLLGIGGGLLGGVTGKYADIWVGEPHDGVMLLFALLITPVGIDGGFIDIGGGRLQSLHGAHSARVESHGALPLALSARVVGIHASGRLSETKGRMSIFRFFEDGGVSRDTEI